MEARETPIDFEGETSLKEFFKQIDKTIKQLEDDHDIDTIHKSLMAKYLLQIKQEGGRILRDHLMVSKEKDRDQ